MLTTNVNAFNDTTTQMTGKDTDDTNAATDLDAATKMMR